VLLIPVAVAGKRIVFTSLRSYITFAVTIRPAAVKIALNYCSGSEQKRKKLNRTRQVGAPMSLNVIAFTFLHVVARISVNIMV